MTPAERNKLIGILGRLASPYDGERAAAGLLATRFLTNANESWASLLAPQVEYRGRTASPPPTGSNWRDDLSVCCAAYSDLTEWERGFIYSIGRRFSISPKQAECLARIAQRLRRST